MIGTPNSAAVASMKVEGVEVVRATSAATV